jgi:phosphatidylglycerophosphate synthase
MAGFLVIYLVTDKFLVRPSRAGKFCTFMQIFLVAWTLLAPDLNRLHAQLGSFGSLACGWAVVATSLGAVVSYTRTGLAFIHAEQKPLEDHGHGGRN